MKKLRVVARVYDMNTREFVQRMAEIPVSDELVKSLQQAIHPEGPDPSPIHAFGHGDGKNRLGFTTPLASQKRFRLDPVLEIIDENNNIIGGWCGM